MPTPPTQRASTVIARCREIAACTEVLGETTRTFLAPSMHAVHALLRRWMEAAGMSVSIDPIGNLRSVYPSTTGKQPRLVIGSHLDTVPNAGAFDGILGVVLGVALVEALHGEQLPFGIEVVGFSEEEGVRFGKPYLGSLAFAGAFDIAMLDRKDAKGISMGAAIRAFGLAPEELQSAAMNEDTFAYLEVHIEQGPVLESEGLQLGVVSAIAGQTRMELSFTGQANHAGTTPMHLRHDAMAAAAQWIVEVERYAHATQGLVATVGRVETYPGAGNVIAGKAVASLDVRHAEDRVRRDAVALLVTAAKDAAASRGVRLSAHENSDDDAVATDSALSDLLRDAVVRAGMVPKTMVSGAGHDARVIAGRLPVAMLFLRSPAGLSHHPDESVVVEDVEAALAASLEFVQLLSTAQPPLRSAKGSMYNLGHTRSSIQRDHILQTPDTFIRTVLPGMKGAAAVVHVAPAAGAAFTQYTAELAASGTLGPTSLQRFVYVIEGVADLATHTSFKTISAGGFAYIPAGTEHTFTAQQKTVLAVIEKPYEPLGNALAEAREGLTAPALLIGHEDNVVPAALMGDEDLQVRSLLPDDASFDFAVNTMTYQPGAALAMVEVHMMEHGLLMLEGGGIYRLGERWYPVTAGDFIWMAPFCPQWFGALGKRPAKYLIYKDWNRHPIA